MSKKLNPGWHEIVLSDRQIQFIKIAINLYFEASDYRERYLIEEINARLDGGEE